MEWHKLGSFVFGFAAGFAAMNFVIQMMRSRRRDAAGVALDVYQGAIRSLSEKAQAQAERIEELEARPKVNAADWRDSMLLPTPMRRASDVRQRVFDAIGRERAYQRRKWGDVPREVGAWLTVMRAELAEAEQAWVKRPGDADALREMLQVVSVGVAALEQHGVHERDNFHTTEVDGSDAIR